MRMFSDHFQQFVYKNYFQKTTEEIIGEMKKCTFISSHPLDQAFLRGYTKKCLEGDFNYPRTSAEYAAYCAGKDKADAYSKRDHV